MTLLMGAVAYDPKVVTIWEGFKTLFAARGLDFDFVLYSNYERQVEAHLRGDIHVAWNSPLAWLQAERAAKRASRTARAVVMRDTDRDLTSVVVVRSDSPVKTVADLMNRTVAVGAADSPQATLIPLLHLERSGLARGSFEARRHDLLLGKHGDHVGGEREAIKALLRGEADAACLIDGNLLAFTAEGTIASGAVRILTQTPPYDHCNFTVFEDVPGLDRFVSLLLEMSWEDPEVRRLLELEGLKRWLPGRTEGYALLSDAIETT
jgi:phosphonate transport system substrate-binding protein